MKKIIVFISLLILPVFVYTQTEKTNCKVLIKELQGEYTGDCKKGLANGKGTAKGADFYQGDFRKGYPHGEGKYIWSENNYYEGSFKKGKRDGFGKQYSIIQGRVSITEGYWGNDVYIGETKNERAYNTISKLAVERVSYINKGVGDGTNQVMIQFSRAGVRSTRLIEDLTIVGSSGTYINEQSRFYFKRMNIPFVGEVKFSALNKMGAITVFYELKFELLKEGNWEVTINY